MVLLSPIPEPAPPTLFTRLYASIPMPPPAPTPYPPPPTPRYIRFIFNRVILENATVRAAAVSALARFGAAVESLRPRVVVLLKRALFDNDDEVRAPGLDVQCLLHYRAREWGPVGSLVGCWLVAWFLCLVGWRAHTSTWLSLCIVDVDRL